MSSARSAQFIRTIFLRLQRQQQRAKAVHGTINLPPRRVCAVFNSHTGSSGQLLARHILFACSLIHTFRRASIGQQVNSSVTQVLPRNPWEELLTIQCGQNLAKRLNSVRCLFVIFFLWHLEGLRRINVVKNWTNN